MFAGRCASVPHGCQLAGSGVPVELLRILYSWQNLNFLGQSHRRFLLYVASGVRLSLPMWVLWNGIVPVVISLNWCQFYKIINLQEFFYVPVIWIELCAWFFYGWQLCPSPCLRDLFLHSVCLWVEHEYCYYWSVLLWDANFCRHLL
jgi:hypothetical protein